MQHGPDPCVCFRNQRGKKKALIGDLAGPCQSHMYRSEDAKTALKLNARINCLEFNIMHPRN